MLVRISALFRRCGLFFLLFTPAVRAAEYPIPVRTVFIILMENHNWSSIMGSSSCPYINKTLLPMASYCRQYYNPPGIHPSEPNYLWLVAGTNFGILDDQAPSINHQSSTNTLFKQLDASGISWKAYQENITGLNCPDVDAGEYAVRHDPFVFFDSVRNNLGYCTNHVRPYTELARDLQSNTVARYNFITPNLTNDMHDTACSRCNALTQGDHWLSLAVPPILASAAYTNNGALFITWDEGLNGDGPIGMIVLSPLAKGHGYSNTNHYTHSSTLRTMQNIFGVPPYLGDALNATDLSDLFVTPVQELSPRISGGHFQFDITNLVSGSTYFVQASTNLKTWVTVKTNTVTTNGLLYTEPLTSNFVRRFYRVNGP